MNGKRGWDCEGYCTPKLKVETKFEGSLFCRFEMEPNAKILYVVPADVSLVAKGGEEDPNAPIVITQQPVDHVGAVNDNVSMTAEATGNGLTYQWYRSNDKGAAAAVAPFPEAG